MKGFINLIKPKGVSSAYAVGAVKKKFHLPCGHMGTLDPMASGVLPVGIDQTSRLFPFLLDKKKTYLANFTFGYTTDTLDVTGEVTDRTSNLPTYSQIEGVLSSLTGEVMQVPPKYSAKCVNGKRGYQLSRQGVEFELSPKKVIIDSLELVSQVGENEYQFKIVCGGGTYVRSICRDVATLCGSLGAMSALERTQSGVFNLSNGVTVEQFINSENPEKYLLPPDIAVNFEKLILTEAQAQKILDGIYLDYGFKDGIYRVYNGEEFWGIGHANGGSLRIKPYVR